MIGRIALVLATSIILAGCAGRHVRPDLNYATAPVETNAKPELRTMRVAFDQEGAIYPKDEQVVPWHSVRMKWLSEATGQNSFKLAEIEASGSKPYPPLRSELEAAAARELNGLLKSGDTLVVLVHGFNEDYDDAQKDYAVFRRSIDAANAVILEVYWDGIKIPFGWLGEFSRATFWPDAVLYSNLAGELGLRPILNKIDRPVDLRILTFSRGAAVAMSTVARPSYDNDYDDLTLGAPRFSNENIRSVKIGAIAAAIGAGHIRPKANEALRGHKVDLVIGANPNDLATGKLGLPEAYGDTRASSDFDFLSDVFKQDWPNLRVSAVVFKHGSAHNVPKYAEQAKNVPTDSMACLLYLLDLRAAACAQTVDVLGRPTKPRE